MWETFGFVYISVMYVNVNEYLSTASEFLPVKGLNSKSPF